MKIWKTDTTHTNKLEETLNYLESKGYHVKEIIPSSFYRVGADVDEYMAETYRIIYTVEDETNESV